MNEKSRLDTHDLLLRVSDQDTFMEFLAALKDDRRIEDSAVAAEGTSFGRGPLGWENHDIWSFLEAAEAWAVDSGFGANQGLGEASPWRKFASFLYSGKIYE